MASRENTSMRILRHLANLINESLDAIEEVYDRAGAQFPSLEASFDREDPANALQHDPAVAAAVLNIMAATAQISATACNPGMFLINAANASSITSCLRVASELNVAERLREAGPEGLHAEQIAPGKVNAGLLARVLRLLATHHIFREVSPNVFANNRISSALDKGKSPDELIRREIRLVNASGPAAVVELLADENMKFVAYLADTALEPKTEQTQDLPFNRAFGTDESYYTWVERPENAWRRQRFGFAIDATAAWEPPDAILTGYDWSALQAGSLLVDLGGGNGNTSMQIVQRNPTLRVVVQDLDNAIKGAKLHWKQNFPSHIESGMVEFQAHNFFTPQPITNATVFLLRYIVHNWPDEKVVQILRHLRNASQPTTRLIVVDMILAYACPPLKSNENEIPGAARSSAPAPLLSNWGPGSSFMYTLDICVYSYHGGEERTLGAFIEVFARAGWKLVRVYHCPASQLSHLECVPV